MTAMYDHLYVYLCQKESLLKYFDQTFYHAVLCRRRHHLSPVLFLLEKGQKRKGISKSFVSAVQFRSSPRSQVLKGQQLGSNRSRGERGQW